MPEYKHLPIIDKWDYLKNRIDREIDDWVDYQIKHPPESEYPGDNMFRRTPERKDAPLYDVRRKMDELDAEERRDKWWVDAICEVCHGDVAEYVMKCLKHGEWHDPDSKATRFNTKSTRQEILDHTVRVIYARYMYDQATQKGGVG